MRELARALEPFIEVMTTVFFFSQLRKQGGQHDALSWGPVTGPFQGSAISMGGVKIFMELPLSIFISSPADSTAPHR